MTDSSPLAQQGKVCKQCGKQTGCKKSYCRDCRPGAYAQRGKLCEQCGTSVGNNQTRKICHSCQDKRDAAEADAGWERLRERSGATQRLPPIGDVTAEQYVTALFEGCDKNIHAMLALANELLLDENFIFGACEGADAAERLVEETVF